MGYFGGSFPSLSRAVSGMNMQMEMMTEEVLRVKLEALRREHRDLDEAIHALEEKGTADQLTLRRLKKQKLVLKDRMALIEDRLLPDIIA
jgi:hypothetical protein